MTKGSSPTNTEETISTVPSTSMSGTVDIRRVSSLPERGIETVASTSDIDLRLSKSEGQLGAEIDCFGFIMNMDKHGNFESIPNPDRELSYPPSEVNKRRAAKWKTMLENWDRILKQRPNLVKKRLRKGIPHDVRGTVWCALGKVAARKSANAGLYQRLVHDTAFGSSEENGTAVEHTKSFKSIQDTIERDIHRTFPRHSMFYEDEDSQDLGTEDMEVDGFCMTGEVSEILHQMENEIKGTKLAVDVDYKTPQQIVEGTSGQASLRRVLKAYSLYDMDIGYCQGMNFIAGMFLTVMSEEDAFWMLVFVMKEEPCYMRGLFGEGMQETHKVLHVAEKLIHQFLPKLARHLDAEHIHVTMYATQWLLTQYTSSFRFDLVTRLWDVFISEGWKVTYRVMLSILQHVQTTLLQMSFEEILAFMRDIPDRVDGNKIVDNAMKIPLRKRHISKYEKDWASQQKQRNKQS